MIEKFVLCVQVLLWFVMALLSGLSQGKVIMPG